MKNFLDKITIKGDYAFVDEKIICMATHPMQPNHSGHARGRSMHLSADNQKTVCNMKFDTALNKVSIPTRKPCKICFKPLLTQE